MQRIKLSWDQYAVGEGAAEVVGGRRRVPGVGQQRERSVRADGGWYVVRRRR